MIGILKFDQLSFIGGLGSLMVEQGSSRETMLLMFESHPDVQ
jgi:hypothetical protein